MTDIPVIMPSGDMLPCAVVLAPRAKYVRVRLSVQGELTLLVPPHKQLSPHEAENILQDMLPWIHKAWQRVQRRKARQPPPQALAVPECIELPAMGEHWQVQCVSGPANSTRDRVTVRAADGHIVLRGSVHNIPLCCKMLQKWLMPHVTAYLQQSTHAMAARHGFSVNKVSVRAQRSRWGSCSRLGNINLNYRVMVLEKALVDYLILHELCHLRHMNHSAAYKACLHSYETRWSDFEKALTKAWHTLPPWILPL